MAEARRARVGVRTKMAAETGTRQGSRTSDKCEGQPRGKATWPLGNAHGQGQAHRGDHERVRKGLISHGGSEPKSKRGQAEAKGEGSQSKPERRQTQSTETAQKGGRPRRGRASQKRSACEAQPGGREAAGKQRRTARREAEGERRQPRQRGRVKERRRPGEEKSRRGERASRQAKDGQRHKFPCGAAHWKKSEARACRPPRAGRSDREE